MGERVRLGDLLTKARSKRCGDSSYPVLSMTMHDGIVRQDDRFKKSIASRDTKSYKVVIPGQLVVGFPIDEGVIYIQKLQQPGIMSPAYQVWDVDESRVRPRYLELALHSPKSMAYYAAKMRGTTARRRSITADNLCALEIPVPSLERQDCIVATFERVGSLLASCEQASECLDSLVKSQFVEMFGDKNFSMRSFSSLATSMQNGLSPSKTGINRAKILTLSAITQGSFDGSAWKEGAFKDDPPLDKCVSGGCYYVCRGNGNRSLVGTGEFAPSSMSDLVFPDTMIEVRVKQEEVLPAYLSIAWKQPFTRDQIERSAKTTNGTYKINQKVLGDVEIPVPPLSLQQQFASFVAEVDKSRLLLANQQNL